MSNPDAAKMAGAAPPMDTVSCTINGVQVTVPKGTRLIEAAEQVGIGIPYYCYHPGLSAPAMCRMCLVEVAGAPKLAPACVTEVADGQVVLTESDKAVEARRGTLEFYLVNHPLDCPVCDKSGECKLQDYVHAEGRPRGRSLEAKRVFGQDDFGGDILYDGDRCIMCTRCVRFMREVAQDDRLCVVQRGHRSVIDTFYDHGVEGSPWAGNIVDICPVGALLSKDFLHKARVWDLDGTPSVCPNCSQGCNVRIDTRDNLIQRLRPRANPDVNSYWMCDYGRYRYDWIHRGDTRVAGAPFDVTAAGDIEAPQLRGANGSHEEVAWQAAVLALVERLEAARGHASVTVVGSALHGNEDNGLLMHLAAQLGSVKAVYRSQRAADEVVCPGFPRLARRRDLTPNPQGLEALGFERAGDDEGRGGLAAGNGVLLVLGDGLADAPADFGRDAALFVVFGRADTAAARNAHFILPVSTFAEAEGTFTNHEGRVQRYWPALEQPARVRPAWQVLGVLLAGLNDEAAPADAASAFLRIAELFDPFAGLSYATIGTRGALLNEPVRLGAGGS
jgi:NADH-quinone oxidoreductase subunit G